MILLIVFILFILSIIEFWLIFFMGTSSGVIPYILFVHFLCSLIAYYISNKINTGLDGFPLYQVFLFPGIGGVIIFCLYIKMTYLIKIEDLVENYDRNIFSKDFTTNFINLKENELFETLSYNDYLEKNDTSDKKRFIMSTFSKGLKYKDMRMSIPSQDQETKHYLATLLSHSDRRFLDNITNYEKLYEADEGYFTLKKLLKLYEEYLYSEILPLSSQYIFFDRYRNHLKKLLSYNKDVKEALTSLIRLDIFTKDLKKAWLMNERYLTLFGKDYTYLKHKSEMLLENKEYSDLEELILSNNEFFPEGNIKFWKE